MLENVSWLLYPWGFKYLRGLFLSESNHAGRNTEDEYGKILMHCKEMSARGRGTRGGGGSRRCVY